MDISSEASRCHEESSNKQVAIEVEQSLSLSSSTSSTAALESSQSEEKEVEEQDRKRKKTHLIPCRSMDDDSVKKSVAVTAPSLQFLEDVTDKCSRREILAAHTRYCLKVRDQLELERNGVFATEGLELSCDHYFAEESEREGERDSVNAVSSADTTTECEDSLSSPISQLLRAAASASIEEEERDRARETVPCRTNALSNIYGKFFTHFQALYNEHDGLAIATLLMIPCCTTAIARDDYVWMRVCDTERRPQSLVWHRHLYGDICYRNSYEYLFTAVPDCIIVFHGVQCHHHSRGTVVVAPYSYFFTIVLPVEGERVQEGPIVVSTLSPSLYRLVQVELAGCKVNYYNSDNVIVRQSQHMALKWCSDPSLSPIQVLKAVYPRYEQM